jgi:hypothetical protein
MIIDFNTIEFYDGDFKKYEHYSELDGHIIYENLWILFKVDGLEEGLLLEFNHELDIIQNYDPGDYWTPPHSETNIITDDVYLNTAFIDNIEIELNKELEIIFTKIIINEINS